MAEKTRTATWSRRASSQGRKKPKLDLREVALVEPESLEAEPEPESESKGFRLKPITPPGAKARFKAPGMSATTIMVVAFGALILGHWSHNQPTINPKLIIEMVFAIVVIALLDGGPAEPIAKGFAWLFLVAVLLRKDSVLTGIANAVNAKANQPKTQPRKGVQVA